jgi:hypothetical protein
LVAASVAPVQAAPCTVAAFNSCYVGVDGSDTQTLTTAAGPYDFVGLGVRSPIRAFLPTPRSRATPTGHSTSIRGVDHPQLQSATIGSPTFRPLDNSVLVGVSLNSIGVLNINGGSITAPMLFAGQADNGRPSTGTVAISMAVRSTPRSIAAPQDRSQVSVREHRSGPG